MTINNNKNDSDSNNNEFKAYIICSGDNLGNLETLDYRCPKKGIEKGDCRLNGRKCEYFLGIKNDRLNFDMMNIKGYCKYILNMVK